MENKKSHTSSEVKMRYNTKTYKNYRVPVRIDSELYDALERLPKNDKENGFSPLVQRLLKEYFGIKN